MGSQKIKILLDKYWNGKSSIKEEAQLQKLFDKDVPLDEKKYDVLFQYKKLQDLDIEGDFSLDFLPEEIISEKETKVVKMPAFVKWSIGVAATVLIAIMSITYQWSDTNKVNAQNDELDRAYTETLAALQLVSEKLNKGNASIMEIGVFDRTKNYILDENN